LARHYFLLAATGDALLTAGDVSEVAGLFAAGDPAADPAAVLNL
jgi:hypothetical protein